MLTIQRDKDKLAASLDGIKNMGGLPDMLFIIDVKQEKTAIQEAKRLGILIAGIVDTNASPDDVNYIVPGNDDAMRAIRFYCKTIADIIIESRRVILEEEVAKEKERAERVKTKKAAPDVKATQKASKQEKTAVESVETTAETVDESAKAPAKNVSAKKKTETTVKKEAAKKATTTKATAKKDEV